MPHLSREGASIHYELEGSGPPLLLIAGIASDGASWRPLVPLLAPHRTLILLDNRGSGRSRAEGALSIDDVVDDCAALVGHLGHERADVLGHSMGGLIGLRLAARHPGLVRRLVTMACGDRIGAKERLLFHDLARLYTSGMKPQEWFRLLFQWLFSEPFFARETNVQAAAEASAAYVFRQSPADFARQVAAVDRMTPFDARDVRCPTLAIAAARDLLVPPEAVAVGHEGIPDHRTIVIADAAHSLHWEAPDPVAEAVLEFLG